MNSPKISIEKQPSKSKYKILRLIPKAAQASVSFQNPPFSPSRDKRAEGASQKLKSRLKKTFSGPIMYMIPAEAREKTKNFETHEPTSPKVSCMGQIKHKNKICRQKQVRLPKESKPVLHSRPEKLSKARSAAGDELKKKPSGIKKILSGRRKSDASINHGKPLLPDRAPSISQMRRFASSRDALADFDWTTAEIEGGRSYSDEESDGEDDEAFIPFSAPILMSGVLEPRKEINLWRRRTMAQPKPLQLNIVRAH